MDLTALPVEIEHADPLIEHHLRRNKFIIKLTLFCLSLEVPFERFALPRRFLSVLVARLRFLIFVWLTIKITIVVLAHECQYSRLRAYLGDWTIYYPISGRVNMFRCFLALVVHQACIKSSSFLRMPGAPFDASLVDFLTHSPPPPPPPTRSSFCSSSAPGGNLLRDRRHWFALSEQLHRSFARLLWFVLPPCFVIIALATLRLGLVHKSLRECDIETPLLRLAGLLELKLCLTECLLAQLGLFIYSLMVKHDIVLQEQRVELCLAETAARLEHVGWRQDLIYGCSSPVAPSLLPVGLAGPCECHHQGPWLASYSEHANYNHLITNGDERATIDGNSHNKTTGHLSQPLAREPPQAQTDYEEGFFYVRGLNLRDPETTNLRLDTTIARRGRSLGPPEEPQQPLPEALTCAIREAQTRVILFLGCLDSHKPVISYISAGLCIWFITSLSYVPVLLTSWRESRGRGINAIYTAGFGLVVVTSLVFMTICASVHQRVVRLVPATFGLCAQHHSSPEALRWNKIFLIWFTPNRCALKVGGFFQLTRLNILKSTSFLVSGLTLVLSYMSG